MLSTWSPNHPNCLHLTVDSLYQNQLQLSLAPLTHFTCSKAFNLLPYVFRQSKSHYSSSLLSPLSSAEPCRRASTYSVAVRLSIDSKLAPKASSRTPRARNCVTCADIFCNPRIIDLINWLVAVCLEYCSEIMAPSQDTGWWPGYRRRLVSLNIVACARYCRLQSRSKSARKTSAKRPILHNKPVEIRSWKEVVRSRGRVIAWCRVS